MEKYFRIRVNNDYSQMAVEYTDNKGKWATQSLYKDTKQIDIRAELIIKAIDILMGMGYAPRNQCGITVKDDVEELDFL